MHSLGRLVLLYANNSNRMEDIVDYVKLTLRTGIIEDMLRIVTIKYSIELVNVIAWMLQENPLKRIDFDNLHEYLVS